LVRLDAAADSDQESSMCGLCGYLALRSGTPPMPLDVLGAMCGLLHHRGPDDEGTYISPDGRAMLGHRRLAILDLSAAGRQPMQNEDGTVFMVCNGEIYNHAELRAPLMGQGHHFASGSDSEVIVHLYEELGEQCVERLDGMFALAIYDARQRTLVLARDRFGIKPLYFFSDSDVILFASEIRALLACPQVPRRVDLAAIEGYLALGAVPSPRTAFGGILKLPPGSLLTAHEDVSDPLELQRYWSVADCEPVQGLTDEECEYRFRGLLDQSVSKMMVSDVPLGVLLSGGTDSAAVCALASRLSTQPMNAFTVSIQDVQATCEDAAAREVAAVCGAAHHCTSVGWEALIEDLPAVALQMEEPIADYTAVAVYRLCQFAKANGITVALGGEGADELLAGYDRYSKLALVERFLWRWFRSSPDWLKRVTAGLLAPAAGTYGCEALCGGVEGADLVWGGATAFLNVDRDRLLGRSRSPCLPLYNESVGQVVTEQRRRGADTLQIAGAVDLAYRLPDLLLTRLDKLSMAWALECRVPFLDHALVEFAIGLRANLKVRRGVTKYPLRRMLPERLPKATRLGAKRGMLGTAAIVLHDPLWTFARRQITDSPLLAEVGQKTAVRHVLERAVRTRDKLSCYRVWVLLNLALWHQAYFE